VLLNAENSKLYCNFQGTRDLYSFFNHFHLALTGHPTAIVFLSVMAVAIGRIFFYLFIYKLNNFFFKEDSNEQI